MVPNLFRGALVLMGALALVLGWWALVRWENSLEAGPPASGATVERRMHITVDTRYDTDKRRKFICYEVK